jgi:pilus assembly protein Flp/PilA
MEKIRHVITALMKDDSGAAAVEYGLIVALISILIVAGALLLGTELGNLFTAIGNFFQGAAGSVPANPFGAAP